MVASPVRLSSNRLQELIEMRTLFSLLYKLELKLEDSISPYV